MDRLFNLYLIKTVIILMTIYEITSRGYLNYRKGSKKIDDNYLRNSSCSSVSIKDMIDSQVNETSADELYDDFFQWRLKTRPEFATHVGIYDYDDRLDSWSVESFDKEVEMVKEYLDKVNSLLKTKVDDEDKLNLLILKQDLELFIKGMSFKGYVYPINFLEGVQVEFDRLISWMQFNCESDYNKLLSRYRAFSKQADELISVMKLGIKEKRVPHMKSMDGVLKQFSGLQVPASESVFYAQFKSMPDSIPTEKQKQLQSEGADVIEKILLPAFKKIETFIEKEYIPALRPDIAATSLPDGKQYYEQCLKYHLSSNMTAQEVHQKGLAEVQRIRKSMEKIKEELGFNGTLQEFFQHLRQEKKFYFTKPEDLLNGYNDLEFDKITPILSKYFAKVPTMKLRIEGLPPAKANNPSAFYMAGSWDGSRPGVFYVNTNYLDQRPKYEMASLALHEGLPGHHFQISYAIEQKGLPVFRQFLEDRRYAEMPSHFALNTAYTEGWGLYSEFLGEEMGIYEDPYSLFGRYSMEIFRACRLVVDTGMHALGWSAEDAESYMLKNTASSEESTRIEIARYITWPGQACAYKIGEMKLKDLRHSAEKALGKSFDVKQFHDVIMQNAATPLSFLEARIQDYINQKKSEQKQ